jgi:hypothetical protein
MKINKIVLKTKNMLKIYLNPNLLTQIIYIFWKIKIIDINSKLINRNLLN